MKKILMLLPLLVFLIGCNKSEDQTSPPAAANTNATTLPISSWCRSDRLEVNNYSTPEG